MYIFISVAVIGLSASFVFTLLAPAWKTILTNNSFFHVEIGGWRTPDRLHSIATQFVAVPFFTILITLNQGKVVAIQYDIDTSWCVITYYSLTIAMTPLPFERIHCIRDFLFYFNTMPAQVVQH
jgi:hypothetical protein